MNILFSVCFSTCAWKKWAYTFEGCSESKTKVMAIISTNHSLLRLRSTNQLHERKTKKSGRMLSCLKRMDNTKNKMQIKHE